MKKLKDYLDDEYGLKELDLTKVKKIKKNKKNHFLTSLLLVPFLFFMYYLINSKVKKTNKPINEIKDQVELKIISSDTSKKEDEINKTKEITPIIIKKKEIIMIEKKTGKYFIISGSFKDYELSLNKANEFLKNGFQSSVILPIQNKNSYYRVAIDVHMNKNDALNALNKYKNNLNDELWILKY